MALDEKIAKDTESKTDIFPLRNFYISFGIATIFYSAVIFCYLYNKAGNFENLYHSVVQDFKKLENAPFPIIWQP